MNRIINSLLLLTLLPAFLMPLRMNVCLVNGLGSTCCKELVFRESPEDFQAVVKQKSCCSRCQLTKPKPEPVPDDPRDERDPQISPKCSCCLAIENTQDDLDRSDLSESIEIPDVCDCVFEEPRPLVCDAAPIAYLQPQHDPPRLLPLQV